MQQSVKNNLALRRGRNNLFERPVGRSYGNLSSDTTLPRVPSAIREKNRDKLRRERQLESRKLVISVVLAVALLVGLWYYWEALVALIVYQTGEMY